MKYYQDGCGRLYVLLFETLGVDDVLLHVADPSELGNSRYTIFTFRSCDLIKFSPRTELGPPVAHYTVTKDC